MDFQWRQFNSVRRYLSIAASTLVLAIAGWSTVHMPSSFASEEQAEWSYAGTTGPDSWGQLAADYAQCSIGTGQSPIDLQAALPAALSDLSLSYRAAPLAIVNNGHTIQVNYAPGSTLALDGKTYELLQFHFHDPSEHQLDGASYPMEAHFVHRHAETGALAVLGVFMAVGEANPALETLWAHMPAEAGPETQIDGVEIDATQLIPTDRDSYYRYFGSLTTPPCSEIVNWIVLATPIEISPEQVEQFVAVVGANARPIQRQNRRFILEAN